MRRTALIMLAVFGVLLAASSAGAQKKNKIPEGMKKKRFHASLYALYPDDKAYKDMDRHGLGIRFKGEGVVVVVHRNYWEIKSGREILELNGHKVAVSNTSKVAKEFQSWIMESCRKSSGAGKNKKFSSKAGKGVYCDVVVTKGEKEFGIKEIELFTGVAAGLDATRSFNPRTIKMHYRPVFIKQKAGVHFLTIMATEGVLKKRKKEINKLLKSFKDE